MREGHFLLRHTMYHVVKSNQTRFSMKITHPARDEIQLDKVLAAFGSPLRLAAIRKVAEEEPCPCYTILPQVTKSTMSHHFRILRESGIVWQHHAGRVYSLTIRTEDLNIRFPGLLDSILKNLKTDPHTQALLAAYPDALPPDVETAR